MLLHDTVPSTSGRHEAPFAEHHDVRTRRVRKYFRGKAQATTTEKAPSNGPVIRENLESPEALKDVERVNPMTDRFEVRSTVPVLCFLLIVLYHDTLALPLAL